MTKIQLEKLDVINYCRIYDKIVKKIPYKNSTKKLSSRFQWKTLNIIKSVSSATSASEWWHFCYHSLLSGPDKIKYSKIYMQKKTENLSTEWNQEHQTRPPCTPLTMPVTLSPWVAYTLCFFDVFYENLTSASPSYPSIPWVWHITWWETNSYFLKLGWMKSWSRATCYELRQGPTSPSLFP